MTILVGQGCRSDAREACRAAGLRVTREGYSDRSTTTWALVVNTRKSPRAVQRLMWASGVGWCDVTKANLGTD